MSAIAVNIQGDAMKRKLPDSTASVGRHRTETDEKNPLPHISRAQRLTRSQEPASEPLDQLERFAPLPCVLPDDEW